MTLVEIATECHRILAEAAPVDTGNLKQSIEVLRRNDNEYHIVIPAAKVPYAVYTNERWISPYWQGKSNPNEKWIDKAVQSMAERLTAMLGGTMSVGDTETSDRQQNKDWNSSRYEGTLISGKHYSSNPLKRWYDMEA